MNTRLDRLITCPDNQARLCTPTLARRQLPPESGFCTQAPQRTVNQCATYLHKVSNRCSPCAYSPRLQMAPDPGSLLLQTLKSHFRHVSNAGWGRRLQRGAPVQFWKQPRGACISYMHTRSREPSQHKSLSAFPTWIQFSKRWSCSTCWENFLQPVTLGQLQCIPTSYLGNKLHRILLHWHDSKTIPHLPHPLQRVKNNAEKQITATCF